VTAALGLRTRPRPLVLAYHGIATVPRELDPTGLMCCPAAFRRHLGWLQGLGYRFVTQREFARLLRAGDPMEGVCSLTLDDGSSDNYEVLPALLAEFGASATVFVSLDLLGRGYPFLPEQAGIRTLTEGELHRLADVADVEIGSHTNGHVSLADATDELAYREMSDSKLRLEQLLGRPVDSFAYPGGRFSPGCPAAAERAGYSSAVACGDAGGPGLYDLRRESPDQRDGRFVFGLKVRGVYYSVRDRPEVRALRALRRSVAHGRAVRSGGWRGRGGRRRA
jgi:peptidoglycan/xylan/chitin deacetylase (PgdA/CDA1 family)